VFLFFNIVAVRLLVRKIRVFLVGRARQKRIALRTAEKAEKAEKPEKRESLA